MALDPKIWGPYYWFVLHTIALTYPAYPNDVIKKKYYDFIQNLPIFIPVQEIGNIFITLLDKYPVTPYLDSQQSFVKWMNFIHNKINLSLELPEMSLDDAMFAYYEHYKPKNVKMVEYFKLREKLVYIVLVVFLLGIIYYFYDK
jgi:hypothetical protein